MTTTARLPVFPTVRLFSPSASAGTIDVGQILADGIDVSDNWRDRAEAFFKAAGVPFKCGTRKEASVISSKSKSSFYMTQDPQRALPGMYELIIDGNEDLYFHACDDAGFYAGLQTLWQLATAGPVPQGVIFDWPVIQTRSFQIDLGRQPETLPELKRVIRQQARYHYNQCQLYLENSIKLPCFGEAADPDGLTVGEFKELQDYANALGVDLVPSLNLLGHMEKLTAHPRFAHLSEVTNGARHPNQKYEGCICPALPESKALVASAIAEMAAITKSKWMMVGLDECWTLGSHPLTRPMLDADSGAGSIFRDWILFLHAECTKHGKQMWMWEDMLFYHRGAIGNIPADVGMCNWHYQHIESVPMYSFQNWNRIDSFRLLSDAGHPIMLCCYPVPSHLLSMIRYAETRPLQGIVVVQWEGSHTVQESTHIERVIAAGVIWSGQMPDPGDALHAITSLNEADSAALGELVVQHLCKLPTKQGGSTHCPRFWSWPENAAAMTQKESFLRMRRKINASHEALEMFDLTLEHELTTVTADWARENAALVGRDMLQRSTPKTGTLHRIVAALENANAIAETLPEKARRIQDRYTAGMPGRKMTERFEAHARDVSLLLTKLQNFKSNPTRENWPFAAFSLHLDLLTLDPCAHHVRLSTSDNGTDWKQIHEGGAHIAMEGEAIMSFAVPSAPRFVKLEVGGFASLAVTRIRLETLEGTRTAKRLVESVGHCINPEHLLRFDRTIAIFNPPDVMSNWLSLTAPKTNYAIIEF